MVKPEDLQETISFTPAKLQQKNSVVTQTNKHDYIAVCPKESTEDAPSPVVFTHDFSPSCPAVRATNSPLPRAADRPPVPVKDP